jgi:predicted nucleic acid binding AN1-type Zn finger protein
MNQTNFNNKNSNPQPNKNSTMKPEPKEKKQKGSKIKKEKETNWDEIEDILNDFKNKDKYNCNFTGCGSPNEIRECVFCNMYFCNEHVRQPIHDCSYLKNMRNFNADYYKNWINTKIDNLEKERNKKEKPKKK